MRAPGTILILVSLGISIPHGAEGQAGNAAEPPTEIIVAASVEPAAPKPGDSITITTLVSVFGHGNFLTTGELVSPNGFAAKVLPDKNQGAVDGRKFWTITTRGTVRERGPYRFTYRMWVDSAQKQAVQGVLSFHTEGTDSDAGGDRRSVGDVAGNRVGSDATTRRPVGDWLLSDRKGINTKGDLAGFKFETGLNTLVLHHEGGARVTKAVWTSPPERIPTGRPLTLNALMLTTPDKPLEKETQFRLIAQVEKGTGLEKSHELGDASFVGHGVGRAVEGLIWSASSAYSVTLTPYSTSSAPFSFRVVLYARGVQQTVAEYSYVRDKGPASGVSTSPRKKQ